MFAKNVILLEGNFATAWWGKWQCAAAAVMPASAVMPSACTASASTSSASIVS